MKKHFLFIAVLAFHLCIHGQVKVENLLCENVINPIGIDITKPLMSWSLLSDKRGTSQTAYEIMVSNDMDSFDVKKLVWTTKKIFSSQSVHVPYLGATLQSGTKYFWKVRVWDNFGRVSPWSVTSYWQMGLTNKEDWKAKWIQIAFEEDSVNRPSPIFRKEFTITKKIKSATAFITSHGLYEGAINGKKIGDAFFTPGWSSYNKRLQYQSYDVTSLIKSGGNAIGVTLGNGWYRGPVGWIGNKNIYGKELGLLFQLQIEYSDGTKSFVTSDGSWKSTIGSIRSSDIYNGETIDARKEKVGWLQYGYGDSDWFGVNVKEFDNSILVASYKELPKRKESFKPLKISRTPKNELIVDFGQNLVGFVQLRISGSAGDSIIISHAEVLDKAGNFYTDNLRKAKQQNIFVLKGNGIETFEPHFTYQGFRYVRIDNYQGDLKPEDITAYALYADLEQTGSFNCSNPLLNQLQHNIQWGQKGNYLSVPTDCPQRDERLGWTGDAQVFFRTGAFNMHSYNFFSDWLKDLAADQTENGSVPHTIPNPFIIGENNDGSGSAGWSDASTIIPWDMYLFYGNKRILEEQYSSMKAWVDFITSKSKNYLWVNGWHFGDWLSYIPENDWQEKGARTDKQLIAQCFYAHSAELLAKTAQTLNKIDDFKMYSDLSAEIKKAYLNEYVTGNTRLISNTQTAYVLALHFDMLPESMRPKIIERLVQNIYDYNDHLTTGFLGTPYLCHVLSRFGHTDLAYKLLLQTDYPSWLYQVKAGATTIWERWDGQKPDGSFQDIGMNSFNHYAYGAIGDWMYRIVAGLNPNDANPGYKEIIIKPQFGGGLTSADASLLTFYGRVRSAWKIEGDKINMTVEIPCNTTASVFVPATTASLITESGKSILKSKDIVVKNEDGKVVELELGSGKYVFTASMKQD